MDGTNAAIERLIGKADGAARLEAADIDWSPGVTPPRWMTRRAYINAISQMHHAEAATGRMCAALATRLPAGPARRFLRLQAADEARHAALYAAYLTRLGDIAPMEPGLREAIEGALDWQGSPLAILLAYNIILEGEALHLQKASARVFPCAVLKRITSAIARDESRHIAFGARYLRAGLAALPHAERMAIFRWLAMLWSKAGAPPTGDSGVPAPLFRLIQRRYMDRRWRVQRRRLARLGLLRPGEAAPVDT